MNVVQRTITVCSQPTSSTVLSPRNLWQTLKPSLSLSVTCVKWDGGGFSACGPWTTTGPVQSFEGPLSPTTSSLFTHINHILCLHTRGIISVQTTLTLLLHCKSDIFYHIMEVNVAQRPDLTKTPLNGVIITFKCIRLFGGFFLLLTALYSYIPFFMFLGKTKRLSMEHHLSEMFFRLMRFLCSFLCKSWLWHWVFYTFDLRLDSTHRGV